MALFLSHIEQAKRNLDFLQHINKTINDRFDWQVTVSFYVAVHLINGYIADKTNEHYRSHSDVLKAINPFGKGITSVSNETYLAFRKLQMLSRRSRYLINDKNPDLNPEECCLTYSIHFHKTLVHLEKIIIFIELIYKDIVIPKIQIKCIELSKGSLKHFDSI